jgi:hypothetical protein
LEIKVLVGIFFPIKTHLIDAKDLLESAASLLYNNSSALKICGSFSVGTGRFTPQRDVMKVGTLLKPLKPPLNASERLCI